MIGAGKLSPVSSIAGELKSLFPALTTARRRTKVFAYGFVVAFVAATAFLAFSPSSASPWFNTLSTSSSSSSSSSFTTSIAPSYRSQFSSLVSFFFPNSSSPIQIPARKPSDPIDGRAGSLKDGILGGGSGANPAESGGLVVRNETGSGVGAQGNGGSVKNQTVGVLGAVKDGSGIDGALAKNQTAGKDSGSRETGAPAKKQTDSVVGSSQNGGLNKNQTGEGVAAIVKKSATPAVAATDQGSREPVKKQTDPAVGSLQNGVLKKNQTAEGMAPTVKKSAAPAAANQGSGEPAKKQTDPTVGSLQNGGLKKNQTTEGVAPTVNKSAAPAANQGSGDPAKKQTDPTAGSLQNGVLKKNQTAVGVVPSAKKSVTLAVPPPPAAAAVSWIDKLMGCDIFQGRWVEDDSYPLYPEGSCPYIDEPFDCYRNGRPDRTYQKLRWQPNDCNIPRLNGIDMLERLRGKRLVFVGDSLNRNMWESLVCVLRNSVKNKKNVFEASGRRQFRTEGSYSFMFKDYGCTVEFFRSPFLVQEWEMPDHNGSKKETLRLDLVERLASNYKDAYAIIFNTGHWWTHEKTSQGKDYYQEGNHVYSELNVGEAFHKALNTWAKWVDANVNPKRTHVFFRGYSASHFRGGQWNSGGQCDKETEPIKNEKYLSSYPPKMSILEEVIKGMKTRVSYMNITRMTDYRKDAHPSVYQKPNMTPEERAPDKIQDCSHWCLPGVPDSWNELLYAQLLIKQHQTKN